MQQHLITGLITFLIAMITIYFNNIYLEDRRSEALLKIEQKNFNFDMARILSRYRDLIKSFNVYNNAIIENDKKNDTIQCDSLEHHYNALKFNLEVSNIFNEIQEKIEYDTHDFVDPNAKKKIIESIVKKPSGIQILNNDAYTKNVVDITNQILNSYFKKYEN
jgi:hypothetical protein